MGSFSKKTQRMAWEDRPDIEGLGISTFALFEQGERPKENMGGVEELAPRMGATDTMTSVYCGHIAVLEYGFPFRLLRRPFMALSHNRRLSRRANRVNRC